MLHLAAACLLLCPQDPDRSTPEKAHENYAAARDQLFKERSDAWEKALLEHRERALGCYTESRRKEAVRVWKEFDDLGYERPFPPPNREVLSRTEGQDGTVTLEVRETLVRKTRATTAQESKVDERISGYRYVFEKSGSVWLIKELSSSCFNCGGVGLCKGCKGSGQAKGGGECGACKGGKSCTACKGKPVFKPRKQRGEYIDLDPEGDVKFSSDFSTARAAAQSFLDVKVRRRIEESRRVMDRAGETIRFTKTFFVAAAVKELEEDIEKRRAAARKDWKEAAFQTLGEVKEEGDRARAYWGLKKGFSKDSGIRFRLVLKKVGDKWLVDGEEVCCGFCDETGLCKSCKGTGKKGDAECPSCKGGKSCDNCKGAGGVSMKPD